MLMSSQRSEALVPHPDASKQNQWLDSDPLVLSLRSTAFFHTHEHKAC